MLDKEVLYKQLGAFGGFIRGGKTTLFSEDTLKNIEIAYVDSERIISQTPGKYIIVSSDAIYIIKFKEDGARDSQVVIDKFFKNKVISVKRIQHFHADNYAGLGLRDGGLEICLEDGQKFEIKRPELEFDNNVESYNQLAREIAG